jgi:hypothetical protein
MALAANGTLLKGHNVYKSWPWVSKPLLNLPCGCLHKDDFADGANGTIAHLFDRHVFEKCDWTLDQLIDWVRSVEPQEAEAPPSVPEAVAESVAKSPQSL